MRLIVSFPCLRIFVIKLFAIPMLEVLHPALQHMFLRLKKHYVMNVRPFEVSSQGLQHY
jgi:hypothetical protein